LATFSSPAEAAPVPVGVEWSAPPDCPTAPQVAAEIESLVSPSAQEGGPDSSLPTRPASPLHARGRVTASSGSYQLKMEVESDGAFEVKTIDAESCSPLADTFAFIVAFTLDPSAGNKRAPPAQLPSIPPFHDPAPQPAGESASTPALAKPSRVDVGLGPLVATSAGVLPLPAFGIGARVALGTAPRWELRGTYWADRRATAAVSNRTFGGDVRFLVAEAAACFPLPASAFAACAGAELGRMQATADNDLPVHSDGASLWLALKAGLSARVSLASTLDILFRVDVGVPFFRPSFVLENIADQSRLEVHRPAPVFAGLSIEPEIRFFSTDPSAGGHPL
jgi:hypothetical protein